MKDKPRENNFQSGKRKLSRSRAQRHDAMLVLNLSIFNFTDGWSRTFSKYDCARARA